MTDHDTTTTTDDEDEDTLLDVYLRDHLAGAHAGLALAERCRDANEGSELGGVLGAIATEISADRDRLEAIMGRLGVSENKLKSLGAKAAELLARLKSNGTFSHYSASSRVVELEGLMAGVDAKRNLWASLHAVADEREELDVAELDELIERATSQRQRLSAQHTDAARLAFGVHPPS